MATSPKDVVDRRVTRDEVDTIVENLVGEGTDVFDVLAAALMVEKIDRVIARVRSRGAVMGLLEQTVQMIRSITIIGEKFGVEIDGEVVTPDDDLSKWDGPKLSKLVTFVLTQADSLRRESDNNALRAKVLQTQKDHAEQKIADLQEEIKAIRADLNGQIEEVKSRTLAANDMLARYIEAESSFVVAKVNGASPVFLTSDGGGTDWFGDAAIVSNYPEAHDVRAKIVRAKKAKSRAAALRANMDEYRRRVVAGEMEESPTKEFMIQEQIAAIENAVSGAYKVMRVALVSTSLSEERKREER